MSSRPAENQMAYSPTVRCGGLGFARVSEGLIGNRFWPSGAGPGVKLKACVSMAQRQRGPLGQTRAFFGARPQPPAGGLGAAEQGVRGAWALLDVSGGENATTGSVSSSGKGSPFHGSRVVSPRGRCRNARAPLRRRGEDRYF